MVGKWAYIGGASALLVAGIAATQSDLLRGQADLATAPETTATAAAAPDPATPAPVAPATPSEAELAVARLTASLADQEAENARLVQTLAIRDSVLEAMKATATERDRALDDLRAQLAASEARLAALQTTLADLQTRPGLDPTLAAFTPPAASSAARLEAVRTDAAGLDALFAEKASAALWTPPASTRPVTVELVFDFASAALSPGAVANAAAAAVTLADMDLQRVRVIGHTDRVGSPAANRRLAAKRARVVADALIAAGLPPELIETDGLGETDAPVATDDGVAEPLNRSVAIVAVPHPIS